MTARGVVAPHDTDRALRELLGHLADHRCIGDGEQEAQADRRLYAVSVAVMTAAVVLLLSPVALHRLNFGRRVRPRILVVAHVVTLVGLAFLAAGVVLMRAGEFAAYGIGAALGALIVNFAKTWFTGALPEYWLFALGLLFVLVTLFLPKGVLGLIDNLKRKQASPDIAGNGAAAAKASGG